MAGALVGGALLSAFLQVAFDRLASPKVLDFFRARKLDETLLRKLNVMLVSIDALADDAELKQFRDARVKEWLVAVRDAVFDAEDLLGEIEYEVIKCQVEAEYETQTLTGKVSNFFNTTFSSFNKKIDSEMKQVLEKLEYLASQKGALGLKKATCPSVGSGSKKQTTSLVVQSVIYGRDEDKEVIFNWLTSETGNHKQLSILSVVGMGGVGKTTLAQHVYNDPRMGAADFGIKAWVCVSDDFDVLRLTKAILEAITGENDGSGNLEMVHRKLKERLAEKRFLLVLDDVWNERQEDWEAVKTPLNYGAPGSKILVTTRSEKVASTMRSCMHRLKQIEDEHCWQIFATHAFQDDHLQSNSELKGIAKKIVEKCKGLPLALKSIGSLLRTKSSVSEWENVLKNELWDLPMGDGEIIPALLLSYYHLPSHLKRCFSYCALFPKDYEFKKERLIQLWMAQNFLSCSQQSRSPEEVGEQYFDDLLSKSFFQQSSEDETCFVMHDLLNDLANYVCGDICFSLGVGKAKSVLKTTRHFSIASNYEKYFDVFESLPDAERLRTFFSTIGGRFSWNRSWKCKISIHELFSKFKFLHVLSLSRCSDLREVSDSLGELKHLRSLDLSWTGIEKLPASTCLLYNLQILKLVGCWRLEELPMKLYKLTDLRCLEFRHTGVRRMPMHFGKLKNLQVLDVFCAGKSSEFSVRELRGHILHGWLSMKELQNIEDPSDALAVDLINKTRLEGLRLEWNREHILVDDPRKEKEVVENLQPSKHLKNLSIANYGGTEFPSWLSNNSLSNMVYINMKDCKYCICLPCLGHLPSLKELMISGLDGIVNVGAEFYGSSSSPFPSLEKLYFYDMKEWEEWECTSTFPSLQGLSIHSCPKLKGVSEQLLNVKEVYISGPSLEAQSLETIGHAASNTCLGELSIVDCSNINIPTRLCCDFLQKLFIYNSCDSLTTFPLDFFPKLCSLHLGRCGNLQMISQERTHNHLEKLSIVRCHQFESFPSEGLSAPKLETFSIKGLENLKSLPKCMHILLPSLADLCISNCPKVEIFTEGGLSSNLKGVTLSSYKLIASLKGSVGVNTCLETLFIQGVDEVECFPDEDFLPLSLTALTIKKCRNLKKVDYKGLCQLSSLKKLNIESCPKLEWLPEEGLPKSISTLQIRSCPLLEQRCHEPEGEEWRKIAGIQHLRIGW